MRSWLSAAAVERPGHPFLVTPEQTLSFSETEERVRRATGALFDLGVREGDRVGVWAANDPATVVSLLAVPRVGASAVLLNTRLTPGEARAQLERAGSKLALGDPPDLGLTTVRRLDGEASEGMAPRPDREQVLAFTSGSSGLPKGVRLTTANLEASAEASARHLRHAGGDRWLCVLPLYHVGGLSILFRSAREATTVLLEPRFDPGRAASLLRDGDATLASLVAAMLDRILDADPGPFRGVRAVLVGGGPGPPELLHRAAESGLPVLPTYGLTETASQIATARLEDGYRPRPRVFPLPGAEIRLDASGGIRVRGSMVSPGYLGEPDRTPGEWLSTGDIGEIDDEGGLWVLGRADDVIVTGGENVHPAEVESVLRDHRGVEEVVVLGMPDPVWGSVVTAVYQGTAAAGELDRHVRHRLAGFKVPRRWTRVERIPLLGTGKPDRDAVRRSLA